MLRERPRGPGPNEGAARGVQPLRRGVSAGFPEPPTQPLTLCHVPLRRMSAAERGQRSQGRLKHANAELRRTSRGAPRNDRAAPGGRSRRAPPGLPGPPGLRASEPPSRRCPSAPFRSPTADSRAPSRGGGRGRPAGRADVTVRPRRPRRGRGLGERRGPAEPGSADRGLCPTAFPGCGGLQAPELCRCLLCWRCDLWL